MVNKNDEAMFKSVCHELFGPIEDSTGEPLTECITMLRIGLYRKIKDWSSSEVVKLTHMVSYLHGFLTYFGTSTLNESPFRTNSDVHGYIVLLSVNNGATSFEDYTKKFKACIDGIIVATARNIKDDDIDLSTIFAMGVQRYE